MKQIAPEFSHIVDARLIPAAGMELRLTADESQRRALAKRFDIPAIDSLTARVVLKRTGRDKIRVSAEFDARVEQVCVVTLEQFAQDVSGDFRVVYAPEQEDAPLKLNEIDVDPDEEDVVEYPADGKIDAGELVAEYLSLALDPFPHAPDAVFHDIEAAENDEIAPEKTENPFGVLEKLKIK